MKKILSAIAILAMMSFMTPVMAKGTEGTPGHVSGRSVAAGLVSLIIWPGLGQLINENPKDKNITHAVLGLTGVFRLWSCYDGWVDRTGGVWHNRI